MAISNTSILIKRSSSTATPSSLQNGELAYSFSSNTIFIGGPGSSVLKIGGQAYTSVIDAATSANTASTLVKRDSNGAFAGLLYGVANAANQLQNSQNFSVSGGDITASTVGFNGTSAVVLNASLNSIPGLSAGTYGSSSAVPVVTVAANGRVTSVSTQAISTSFNISDGTTSNTINGGATLSFKSGGGVTTTVTPNTVTFGTDNTVLRSNTTGVGTQVISTDLTVAGNLIVSGTQTYVNTSTVVTNDSLIKLAANNTVGDVVDIGFYGQSNTGSSVAYHGLVREGSGGTSAGNFFLFKNLATDPTSNTINYSGATRATLIANLTGGVVSSLATPILPADGGTGTTSSTGSGSVVLNTNPIFSGTATFGGINVSTINVSTLNVTTLNVTTVNVNAVTANTFNIGSLTYAASGAFVSFGSNANGYQQVVIQNANNGTQASADFVVSNDVSTDTTFYGDFGINSSKFSGIGALDGANNVYLLSQSSDLAIGTVSSNAIHFVVNHAATDAMTINANGVVTLGTALSVPYGGTGASTFNAGQIVVGNGTGALQTIANSSFTVTGSGAANNTITSLTVDAYGRATAATYSAISGLTVPQGGTGLSTATLNGITFGNGTGALGVTAAAGASDQTWSNQILTVTNAGVPVWSSALDGGQF